MSASTNSTILTTDEVASLLRTTRSTVYEMIRQGTIPAQKVGRAYRFSQEAVLAWLRAEGRANHSRRRG
jgi:excisionase family DNA binding protein